MLFYIKHNKQRKKLDNMLKIYFLILKNYKYNNNKVKFLFIAKLINQNTKLYIFKYSFINIIIYIINIFLKKLLNFIFVINKKINYKI